MEVQNPFGNFANFIESLILTNSSSLRHQFPQMLLLCPKTQRLQHVPQMIQSCKAFMRIADFSKGKDSRRRIPGEGEVFTMQNANFKWNIRHFQFQLTFGFLTVCIFPLADCPS